MKNLVKLKQSIIRILMSSACLTTSISYGMDISETGTLKIDPEVCNKINSGDNIELNMPITIATELCQVLSNYESQKNIKQALESKIEKIQDLRLRGVLNKDGEKDFLKPAAKNFLAVTESLLYCKLAQINQKNLDSAIEKERFCDNRIASKAVLEAIDWNTLKVEDSCDGKCPESFLTFSTVLAERNSCSNDRDLVASYYEECQVSFDRIDHKKAQKIAHEYAKTNLDKVIGPESTYKDEDSSLTEKLVEQGSDVPPTNAEKVDELASKQCPTNPLSNEIRAAALMDGKCKQVELASKNIASKVKKILVDEKASSDTYDRLSNYETNARRFYATIEDAYNFMYGRARGFTLFFKDWKNSLISSDEGKQLRQKLVGSDSSSLKNRLEVISKDKFGDNSDLVARVKEKINAEAVITQRTAKLCAVYYCQIARKYVDFNINDDQPLDLACELPKNTNNPLCTFPLSNIKINDQKLSEVCSDFKKYVDKVEKFEFLKTSEQSECFALANK